MNETLAYDVIVVGARVAGSLVATLLGEGGHRVLLLDRARFPSDTLSTHFFRAPSFRAFHQAGAYHEVQRQSPHLAVNYNVVDGIVFPEPVDRPEDYPFYLCVRRITLDDILIQRAKTVPHVELRESAKVERLIREDGKVTGVAWREPDGAGEARARVVVGADGVRSFVAGEVGARAEHQEPVRRAMYYAYFRGVEQADGPAAEFHYRGNSLVYCFPCDDGLTLLAASVPIEEFKKFKADPEGSLLGELRSMADLAPRLEAAEREGEVKGTGSIPGYLRVPWGEGWALVGDSGMVMDPWSGQGIDQASTHAVLLAGRLSEFLRGRMDWPTAMQQYHRDRNEFSLKTYQRTCKYAEDLRPMTREALQRRGLA
ncbi:MAG TPA: NAD(P)/FAD-dependent oxidoreductase [Anaerolineales bacterium]|nr:NAD(P)/FAD-dependent oxidoreductase [Anaerolineales bacterium]